MSIQTLNTPELDVVSGAFGFNFNLAQQFFGEHVADTAIALPEAFNAFVTGGPAGFIGFAVDHFAFQIPNTFNQFQQVFGF
jgi:hypothetical protein